MFERYTESARRVLFFARYEASQLGATSIDTDHVLLGLTREAKGIVCDVFALSHVSLKSIRHEIEARAHTGEQTPTSIEIPFTNATKRVLQFTTEEADRLRHRHIGTEHMLLGLMREASCSAALTLAAHGLRVDDVRAQISSLGETSAPGPIRASDLSEQVEQIKRLVQQLAGTAQSEEERKIAEQILRDLDALKWRYGD